jgi:hypothetical protein
MGHGHVAHQAIDVCRGGRQTGNSLDRGQSRLHPTWRAHSIPGPTLHSPLNGAGPPGRIFQARDWRPPRDCHFGAPKAPSGADSCDVGPFPGPRTASGRLSGVQTLTHASTWNRFSWHACHVFCTPKLMEASVRVRGGEACRSLFWSSSISMLAHSIPLPLPPYCTKCSILVLRGE